MKIHHSFPTQGLKRRKLDSNVVGIDEDRASALCCPSMPGGLRLRISSADVDRRSRPPMLRNVRCGEVGLYPSPQRLQILGQRFAEYIFIKRLFCS